MIVEIKPKENVSSPQRKSEAPPFLVKKEETEQSQHQCHPADHQIQHPDPAEIIGRAEEIGWDETSAELLTEEACDPDPVDDIRRPGQNPQKSHEINLRLADCFGERISSEGCSKSAADDEERRDEFDVNRKAAKQPRDDRPFVGGGFVCPFGNRPPENNDQRHHQWIRLKTTTGCHRIRREEIKGCGDECAICRGKSPRQQKQKDRANHPEQRGVRARDP